MIKNKILKNLPKKNDKEYDVSELCLREERPDAVDFIAKFIRWNKDCKKLNLCNIDLSMVQDEIKYAFDP